MSNFLKIGEWQQLNVRLNRIYCRSVHSKFRHYRKMRRDGWAFWIVRKGKVRIEWDHNCEAIAEAGQVMQPPPLPVRIHDFSDDVELLSICWLADWPIGLPLFNQPNALVFPISQYPDLAEKSYELLDLYGDIFYASDQKDPLPMPLLTWPRIEGCFLEWVQIWMDMMESEGLEMNRPASIDVRVHRAIRFIQAIPVSGPVPYENLCKATGLSRVQLDRIFRKQLGMSPKEYLNRCILLRAKDEVLANRLTCSEISEMLGFCSQSHFTRWFQKLTHNTPKAFRRINLVLDEANDVDQGH